MAKDHIYATKPHNLDRKQCIRDVTLIIPVEMCHHTAQSAFNHIPVCIKNNRQKDGAVYT